MKRNVEDWIQGRGPKLDLIDQVLQRVLADEGLACSRMISQSKSTYSEQHPDHKVFFNACIFVRVHERYFPWPRYRYQQVWWGDLDLDVDTPAIQKVATLRNETLYVTREGYSWDGLTDKEVKENRRNTGTLRTLEGIVAVHPDDTEQWYKEQEPPASAYL